MAPLLASLGLLPVLGSKGTTKSASSAPVRTSENLSSAARAKTTGHGGTQLPDSALYTGMVGNVTLLPWPGLQGHASPFW